MKAYQQSHEMLSEEVGWRTMFAEVLAIAAKQVPDALRTHRRTTMLKAMSPLMMLSPRTFSGVIGSPNQGTASQLTQAQTNEIALSSPQHSQVSPIIYD